jgi:hypothetical protein
MKKMGNSIVGNELLSFGNDDDWGSIYGQRPKERPDDRSYFFSLTHFEIVAGAVQRPDVGSVTVALSSDIHVKKLVETTFFGTYNDSRQFSSWAKHDPQNARN